MEIILPFVMKNYYEKRYRVGAHATIFCAAGPESSFSAPSRLRQCSQAEKSRTHRSPAFHMPTTKHRMSSSYARLSSSYRRRTVCLGSAAPLSWNRLAFSESGANNDPHTHRTDSQAKHGPFAKVKFTGLAHNLGQLQASNMDFQSNCWTSSRILGQPVGQSCGFAS